MLLATHFILLLFALGSSAHSLFRIQITNGSDIYKVKEKPHNTFKIIEPKLKVPTLREITYLKIKQTPSKDCLEKEKLPQEQGPDFDDSERPYTNGQGFQFLEFRPVEEQNSSEDDKNSNNHSNESKNDRSDYESVPDSDESSNESDDSNDSDSDESSDSDSDDSSDSDNDSSSDSDSDSSSHEDWPDIHKNNKNSDDSKESNSDKHESKPDGHENNKDSDDSRLTNGDNHDTGPNSLEHNKDSDQNRVSESDNHESRPDESNNDSGSDGSLNNSKEANKDNSGGNESKNNSKESNNGNIGSNDSNNDSKETNKGNSGTNESKNDSKKSYNGNIGSNDSNNNSKETNKGNSGTNESKNDSKESYNGNIGSNDTNNDSKETNKGNSGTDESKNDSKESYNGNIGSNDTNNDSKETNKGNSGTDESKNDSHELQNNSNKNDSQNESKADNSNLKGFSSDANDGNDEDKGNGSRDTSMGLDERNGGSRNVNEISDNVTADTSQSTEPAAAVSKDETDSTKLLRRKRDIDFGMLPPPPVLQPLNTRMLPDFIQRMLSNIPALNDVISPDEGGESNYQNEQRPQNYGFHFNNDNGRMWNNLPFINQENYINEPSNMMNKEKQEEYQEDVPDSDASSSYDNSLYSENDSGYNAETDEGIDKSGDDNSIGGVWPNIGAPAIDFNNFMPHNPIPKEKEFGNFGNEINKNSNIAEQREPTIERTTETNIENRYKKSSEKETNKAPIYTPPPKTKININKDLKEKIEMSFDNIGKIAPPILTRFEENLVKTAVKNNETPLTFGMKLSGGNGFVWNDLADPGKHYLFGETIDTDKEWNEPSYPATDKFHEYNTEPTSADGIVTETNEPTNPPIHKDEVTTQRVPKSSTESQPQKPTTECEKLNEPNKDSIDKDKDKLDDKKKPEAVQVALDDLLKKDEFWQWLTKWTAAYIGVLNERVEKLVKKEVARQVNKIMNVKVEKEKEKDKIDTNNKDLCNKNETIANVTIVEPANNTNEINTNNTTTEKSSPEANNTTKIDTNNTTTEKSIPEANNTIIIDTNNTTTEKSIPKANNTNDNIASEKDQINTVNKTTSDGHKSNKTTPTNTHTIYGNAIDSDHVTNIFIFYPNAESNATAKDIQAILGNKNNVVVLGKPPNDNKKSKPDCTTNSPFDDTTGIYAIDQKKDIVSNVSEQTSQAPETATSQDPSAADSPVTLKIEDSTAATKPDASGTTEPPSSNSEPIANVSADTVSSNTTESTNTINPEVTNDEATTPSTITTVPDTITTAPVQ